MKFIKKYLFLGIFFLMSLVCTSQNFTLPELTALVSEKADDFKEFVTSRGYSTENVLTDDMTKNFEYLNPNTRSSISLMIPSFDTDVRMISWEFYSLATFNSLKRELVKYNYRLKNSERRNRGKYLSLYYSRPGIDIILTSDRVNTTNAKYIISVKYTNAAKYIIN